MMTFFLLVTFVSSSKLELWKFEVQEEYMYGVFDSNSPEQVSMFRKEGDILCFCFNCFIIVAEFLLSWIIFSSEKPSPFCFKV